MRVPFIDYEALLNSYNKEIYSVLKDNSSFDQLVFMFGKDIIILSESTYDDTYDSDAACICMELIELDDNNNYKYYYYNSIEVMADYFEMLCSDELDILTYYNEDEFYAHKIELEYDEKVNIIKKCIDYYDDIQNITIYNQYTDPIYKNFIEKNAIIDIVHKKIVKLKLSNTIKTIKIFEILLPIINLLKNNNILFNFEKFYIMEYKEPVLIFLNNEKSILIKIIDFENCEDKIIDLRINNNPLEHIIVYHNNKKTIISKTMTIRQLIGEMLKYDTYSKKFLNKPVFDGVKWWNANKISH